MIYKTARKGQKEQYFDRRSWYSDRTYRPVVPLKPTEVLRSSLGLAPWAMTTKKDKLAVPVQKNQTQFMYARVVTLNSDLRVAFLAVLPP